MKILFTGQRGFLGRELIPYLEEQGHDVTSSNIDYSDEKNLEQLQHPVKFVLITLFH